MRARLAWMMLPLGLAWAQPEPPIRYQLTVDGKPHSILLDRPIEVKVGDRLVKLRLSADNYRLFNAAGVSFRYPSGMGYEADRSTPGLTIYSLDGNNVVVMLMCPGQLVGGDDFVKDTVANMKAQYGRGKVVEEPLQLKLNGSLLKGSRLKVDLLGQSLIQDCLGFRHKGRQYLLMLQDSLENGKPSQESQRVLKLLQSSFKLQ